MGEGVEGRSFDFHFRILAIGQGAHAQENAPVLPAHADAHETARVEQEERLVDSAYQAEDLIVGSMFHLNVAPRGSPRGTAQRLVHRTAHGTAAQLLEPAPPHHEA